jgi:hypothetical protein
LPPEVAVEVVGVVGVVGVGVGFVTEETGDLAGEDAVGFGGVVVAAVDLEATELP